VIGSVFVTRILDTDGWTGSQSHLVIGADGLPIMSYFKNTGGDLKVAHCEDAACSSASVSTIADWNWVGNSNGIAIGSDGLPIVSYRDSDAKALKVAHCDDVACLSVTSSTLDSNGSFYGVGDDNSIAIGNDGLAIISYYDRDNEYIKVAHCDDVACSTATIESLSGLLGIDRASTRIVIGSDGLPVVSYWENDAGLKLAHCANPTCDGGESTTLIDGPDSRGRFNALAIGSDGFPVLSYYDSDADDLRVAHCSDLACSSVTITVVDSDGDVGQFNSIAIGEEGFPIISYHDESRGNLKLAFCLDLACSAATFQEIESDNDIGEETSITIAPNGLPIVSFENETDKQLEVAVARSLVDTVFALDGANATAISTNATDIAAGAVAFDELLDCGTLVAASVCPLGAADGPTCDAVPVGSFCEGDGECSTNPNLDNCGGFDWYFKSGT